VTQVTQETQVTHFLNGPYPVCGKKGLRGDASVRQVRQQLSIRRRNPMTKITGIDWPTGMPEDGDPDDYCIFCDNGPLGTLIGDEQYLAMSANQLREAINDDHRAVVRRFDGGFTLIDSKGRYEFRKKVRAHAIPIIE
jgi:hypothetical protein